MSRICLAVISFTIDDLLLCFLSVFRMADNVEATACHVSRTTGDADATDFDNPYRVTVRYTQKYDG